MTTDLARRQIALGVVSLGAASLARAQGNEKSNKSLTVEAPEDAFIELMPVPDGNVKVGQVLVKLRSYRLLYAQDRLALLKEQISLVERPFLDGRVAEEIELLKGKVTNHKALLDRANDFYAQVKQRYDVGGGPITDVTSASIAILKADSDYLDVKLAANQADRKRQEALDNIQLGKDKVLAMEKLIRKFSNELEIKSGAPGTFKSFFSVGAFVKKGHAIGELSI